MQNRSGEKFYLTVVPHRIHLYMSSSTGQKSRITQFPNKVWKSNTEAVKQREAQFSIKLVIKGLYALPDRNKLLEIFQIVA